MGALRWGPRWESRQGGIKIFIRHQIEKMTNAVKAGTAFVVGIDNPPGGRIKIGMKEHRILGPGAVLPSISRLEIHRRQFPLLRRVNQSGLEPPFLHLVAY